MHKLTWMFLLAGLLAQPQVGLYGYLKGNGWPLLTSGGVVDSAVADSMSRYDVVILDAPAPKQRPQMLRALRDRNPDIRLLAYVMEDVYWVNAHPALGDTTTDLPWHYWQAVRDNGGPLLDTSEKSLGTNIANPAQVQALVNVLVRDVVRPGLWDGLFLDVACSWGPVTWTPVDFARMGFPTYQSFQDAWIAGSNQFVAALRESVGTSMTIVGNCGPPGPKQANGWMRENFPWQNAGPSDEGWYANMVRNQWKQLGFLSDPSFYQQPAESWLCWEPGYDIGSAESQKRSRFTLGSACLGQGVAAVGRHEWEPPRYWWFAEYGTPGSHWLGTPEDDARSLKNGLWMRRFQFGMVVVNPTYSQQSIYLDTRYQNIRGGPWKRAFTVPARDGLFLRK